MRRLLGTCTLRSTGAGASRGGLGIALLMTLAWLGGCGIAAPANSGASTATRMVLESSSDAPGGSSGTGAGSRTPGPDGDLSLIHISEPTRPY